MSRTLIDFGVEYYNTNGLGLMEFLEWTESMEMQNVLAIYSGYSLGDADESDADEFPPTDAEIGRAHV